MSDLPMARRIPPGRLIKRELEELGWTQKDLAAIMGRPEQVLSAIINGKKSITPETAVELGAALGTTADLWLNLEYHYRMAQAKAEHDVTEIARKSLEFKAHRVNDDSVSFADGSGKKSRKHAKNPVPPSAEEGRS